MSNSAEVENVSEDDSLHEEPHPNQSWWQRTWKFILEQLDLTGNNASNDALEVDSESDNIDDVQNHRLSSRNPSPYNS